MWAYWRMGNQCYGCRKTCRSNEDWWKMLFGRKYVSSVGCMGRVRGVWLAFVWRWRCQLLICA